MADVKKKKVSKWTRDRLKPKDRRESKSWQTRNAARKPKQEAFATAAKKALEEEAAATTLLGS